ncbi:transposase family protein [Rathayibacter iranicus]|nr:transposase family protein [Rathayibacter iranicus]
MYHTTGFTTTEITKLCALVAPHVSSRKRTTERKSALSFFRSVAITLAYLRRNHVQHELAEMFGASQATISRIIAAFVPALTAALADWVPAVYDFDSNGQYICWSWQNRPELYSGKHKRTGVIVQVARTLGGQLAWVSDPLPDSVHDAKALQESGFLDTGNGEPRHFENRGYNRTRNDHPQKKPVGHELTDEVPGQGVQRHICRVVGHTHCDPDQGGRLGWFDWASPDMHIPAVLALFRQLPAKEDQRR